jgi:hypothetical protein
MAFPGANFAADAFPFGAFATDDPPASMWALSSQTGPYAPRPEDVFHAAPALPFGTFANRTAAAAFFAARPDLDPSPWRPMADSTWGAVFDVLVAGLGLSSASAQVGSAPNNVFGSGDSRHGPPSRRRGSLLPPPTDAADPDVPSFAGYAVVAVLGPVNLTAPLKAALLAFAGGGGTVLVAAGVVGPGDGDLTGLAALSPELRAGRAWTLQGAPAAVAEPFRYVLADDGACSAARGCTVLAATAPPACGGGLEPCPLLVRQVVGSGAVVTCLVPWFVDAEGGGLSRLARAALDLIVAPVQPVAVSGPWPVYHAATADAAGAAAAGSALSVLIANNEGAPWRGNVTVATAAGGGALSRCTELRSEAPVPVSADRATFALDVGAFDVAVVECLVGA